MISFDVGIKNLPTGAKYWKVFYMISESTCTPTTWESAPFNTPNALQHFSVEDSWNQGFFRVFIYSGMGEGYYIGYKTSGWYVLSKSDVKYTIDFATMDINVIYPPTEGFSLEMLLPMSPMEGPPLPRCLGIYWPWFKQK